MPYLIDGNNLIGQTSSFSLRDPRSRLELLGQLLLFQRATRARVWVVFDGWADASLEEECRRWEKFRLLFPPEGAKADDVITGIIKETRNPRTITLVTSDRELRTLGRTVGVNIMSSQEFERLLKKVLKEKKKERELKKPLLRPSPLETSLWIETFFRKK